MTTFTAAFKSADTDNYGATYWYAVQNDVTGETEEWGVPPPDDKTGGQHWLLDSDGCPCAALTDDLWIDHDRSAFVSECGEVNEVARAIRVVGVVTDHG